MSKEILQITIPEADQEFLYSELTTLAVPHINAFDGKLGLLANDVQKYPEQSAYYSHGNPLPAEQVKAVATIIDPRFESVVKHSYTNTEQKSFLDEAAAAIDEGLNVIVATNHKEIIDVALAQCLVYDHLKNNDRTFETGIIIGKLISILEYGIGGNHMPTVDAIKLLCDNLYISFPMTKKMRESKIVEKLKQEVADNNSAMREKINKDLGKGGLLLAMAPSGTTDSHIPNSDTYNLSSVGTGTTKLMIGENTRVLPVAVWMHGDEPFIDVVSSPQRLYGDRGVKRTMRSLADHLNEKVPNTSFVYGRKLN